MFSFAVAAIFLRMSCMSVEFRLCGNLRKVNFNLGFLATMHLGISDDEIAYIKTGFGKHPMLVKKTQGRGRS
jgi:hypothetical protein